MPPTLDAALLRGWVRAATQALERHRAEMDRINVFPVPDGDTGTNLLLTMRSAAESLRRRPRAVDGGEAGFGDERTGTERVLVGDAVLAGDAEALAPGVVAADSDGAAEGDVAADFDVAADNDVADIDMAADNDMAADTGTADAGTGSEGADTGSDVDTVSDAADTAAVAAALAQGALLGARGNSGVILSQVLRGVADAVAAVAALSVAAVGAATAGVRERAAPSGGAVLADALARAARLATATVSRPREGTVLSVLASAAGAARAAGSDRLDDVAVAAADAAAGALRATTGQLPELARAGVVDAGGMGVYLVLDALAGLVSGRAAGTVPIAGGECDGQLPAGRYDVATHRYEVMYLLATSPAMDAGTLRTALEQLGDSVAVGDDGSGMWTVHVHCADIGAAIEAGIGLGRPQRIAVSRLPDEPGAGQVGSDDSSTATGAHRVPAEPFGAGHNTDRFTRDRAVLLIVSGTPVAELARSAGAAVFERAADAAVDPGTLVSALAATGARQVVLLPGAAGLTAVAEKAASTARGNGQEVLVMPTSSVLQGLAALAVHDPERRSDDDAVAMAEAAAGTRTGSLTVAETEALTWAGRCDPGDVLGVTDGEVVLIAPDLAVGALWLAHRMLLAGGELLTVLLGGATDESLAEGLVADLRRSHPEVDVVVHRGGPGGYPLELGVE